MEKEIFVVVESAGVGQLLTVVACYRSREKAERHVELGKMLMPAAANKLSIKEFNFNEGNLP